MTVRAPSWRLVTLSSTLPSLTPGRPGRRNGRAARAPRQAFNHSSRIPLRPTAGPPARPGAARVRLADVETGTRTRGDLPVAVERLVATPARAERVLHVRTLPARA